MKVGFIGLGLMGSSMALNVRAAGHEVTVYDIRREAGEPHLKAGCAWGDGARKAAEGDREAAAAVREAERIFAEHRTQGSTAFTVAPGHKPAVIEQFDAEAEQIIIVPRIAGG